MIYIGNAFYQENPDLGTRPYQNFVTANLENPRALVVTNRQQRYGRHVLKLHNQYNGLFIQIPIIVYSNKYVYEIIVNTKVILFTIICFLQINLIMSKFIATVVLEESLNFECSQMTFTKRNFGTEHLYIHLSNHFQNAAFFLLPSSMLCLDYGILLYE